VTEPVDPDRLEQVEFSVVRRGVDPAAVRSTLAEAADGLRLLTRRCHELEHRIETLEGQIPDPEHLESERRAARAEGRAAGEAEGRQRREDARTEAEALLADAKEEGRRLVTEAQTVRRRMLEDLARRRRSLRQQVEQLRGGRERLLEAYEVVGHTMREATAELSAALPEARAAAERAGHGVGPEETVDQLEAEIESARLAGLPIVAQQVRPDVPEAVPMGRRRPVAVPLERDVRDMPEVEPVVADFEEVRILPDDADRGGTDDRSGDEAGAEPAVTEVAAGPDEGADGQALEPEEPVLEEGAVEQPAVDETSTRGTGAEAEENRADVDGVAVDEPQVDEPQVDEDAVVEKGPVGGTVGAETVSADESDPGDDLFARLRRSRSETADETATESAPDVPPTPGAEALGESPATDTDTDSDGDGATDTDNDTDTDARPVDPDRSHPEEFDHPDDVAEPFGLVLSAESGDGSAGEGSEQRATAEHELARRLKRLLSDEQNDVLDRLRRTRKHTVVVEDLLDGLEERVTRFADAVEPVLADVASTETGPGAQPVDDLAAELAREVAEALADGMVEPLEEELPVDELADPVRVLYRYWKTDRIGALAERYVAAACEPMPPAV
jgi:cell division septum initiation protein DivIVA